MSEKNRYLYNLYSQCQSCANRYTSFECALCEDFDMYVEENVDENTDTKPEHTITITKSDGWQSIEINDTKIENHRLDVNDFAEFLTELGFEVYMVEEDSDC